MILCVVILIDNHNRSRLAATALLSDETKDTFSWLFLSLAKAAGGLIPKLLFTDADPSMIAAASSTWTTTKHHFCLFHIRKNLEKHFLGKYGGEKWKKFFAEFCHVRNSRVESIFEEKWNKLLQNYADAANYLQRQLYPCREAWVLCFTHRAFNAGAQSTQRVESYNGIIKNNVNGSSSLLELEHTIERLLAKESRFIRYNEAIGKLPVSRDEDYHDHYFKEIDMSCQRFLTPALLKLQRHEMNRSMHYRCCNANLKDELGRKFTIKAPNGIFSEDMFDACVIELEQLIVGLDMEKITELWRISSIDKKSQHFTIILYGNAGHLCTCLTLINRGLVCRHFFALMLSSPNAKFHIALISQRWYTDQLIMEGNSMQSSEPVISSVISHDEFGMFEHVVETDFLYLEDIRGCYIFTKEVREEMTQKQQWGKGFGMMKKVLNLAIATGRVEELYEIHEKLSKEMESEMVQTVQGDNVTEFAHTISNPLSVRKKGRKPKNVNGVNKGKKRQIRSSQGNKENISDEDHEELSHKKPRNVLNTVNLELNESTEGEGEGSKSKSRRCGVCNQEGHNARTCSNKKKSTD